MLKTRLVLLDNDRKLIVGKDLDSVFEAGQIYSVEKICGQIILTKIGRMALPDDDAEAKKKGMSPLNGNFQHVAEEGFHLLTVTEFNSKFNSE